jgi:two-component system, OmpR family, sensor kinase
LKRAPGREHGARSFRFLLATRVTLGLTGAVTAVGLLSYLGLREALDRELEASMLSVASIQAASVTDDPTGAMHFHEWELTPEEAASVRDLVRFLQIWDAGGQSLVRTRLLDEDLPLDTAALSRAVAGELVWTDGGFQGRPIRSLYYPLERLGELHIQHVLQVAAPLDGRNRMLLRAGALLLAIVVTVSGATFMGGWWLAGRAVAPVDAIVDQAEDIAAGSPRRSIEAYADTWEYQRLVQVLNRMLERLQAALEAQKRFTADASHELRTPLTVLRGELEVALRRERSTGEYVRVLGSALEEAERLSRLAEDLLTLTRSEAGVLRIQRRRVDLGDQVRRVVARLAREASEKGVEIAGPADGKVPASVDPELIERVVWNLVGNALKFTPPGGRVEVQVRRRGEQVALEVSDTGPGIPEAQLHQVFERFFRGDESRSHGAGDSGSGLGLAIAKAIVKEHDGVISVVNRPSGGALFRVELPGGTPAAPSQWQRPGGSVELG